MPQTILWYDLETFGRIPGWDRVAQFACVRTDSSFEPVEDPAVIYCRITPDYLPDPDACLITGITPRETMEKGLPEREFFKEINRIFSVPGTCVAGFNSIRFDDEFIRYGFYRNFLDPYQREWKNGNSRWDIIDLVRATHDLRPDGIVWPADANGKPVFRLEDLTKANRLEHSRAHDALSDVHATIGMARLIHDKQPKLFSWVFNHRGKESLKPLINLQTMEPLVHTSVMFTRMEGCTTLVAPLTMDPVNRNCVLAFDLREDPSPLFVLDEKEIRRRIFSNPADLSSSETRIPVKGIHLNKCPVLAPEKTMDAGSLARLGLDRDRINHHLSALRSHPEVALKIRKVFESPSSGLPGGGDVDMQLYTGGFFNDNDLSVFASLRDLPKEELFQMKPEAFDRRFSEMFRRYKGRNHPEMLDEQEKTRWIAFCAGRILMPPHPDAMDWGTFRKKLDMMRNSPDLPVKGKLVLKELSDYEETVNRKLFQ
jgi:exodeoxyribonuclease-1